MNTIKIPSDFHEITPQWLNLAFQNTGQDSLVIALTVVPLSQHGGFSSQLARLTLQYNSPEVSILDGLPSSVPDSRPTSVIVKLPAANPNVRQLMTTMGVYEREVRFYEEIAGQTALRTPTRYYSQFDQTSGDYILLIEDLGTPQSQEVGCTLPEAQQILKHLAKFHAQWWENPKLDTLDWLPNFNQGPDLEPLYRRSWDEFIIRFADSLPDWFLNIGVDFGDRLNAIRDHFAQSPRTIVHGDFRLDNVFLASQKPQADSQISTGLEPTIIDWQTTTLGRGIFDLAYLIAGNLQSYERDEIKTLLQTYHAALVQQGVSNYSLQYCIEEHALATLFLMARTVITGGQLDLSNEYMKRRFQIVLNRWISLLHQMDLKPLIEKF